MLSPNNFYNDSNKLKSVYRNGDKIVKPTKTKCLNIAENVIKYLGINSAKAITINFGRGEISQTSEILTSIKTEKTLKISPRSFKKNLNLNDNKNEFFLACYAINESHLIKIFLRFDKSFEKTYLSQRKLINLDKEIIRLEIQYDSLLILSSNGFDSENILFDNFNDAINFENLLTGN